MRTPLIVMMVALLGLLGCERAAPGQSTATTEQAVEAAEARRIGVLLVNHGSRSKTWRQALLDLEARTRDRLLELPDVVGVKTAFMEYTEPSIATQLKAFDAEGVTDVVLVPVFLTVSSHSFDDIPTIIGKKVDPSALETLRAEGIARYTPKARVSISPLLDFTDVLPRNVLRRVRKLSKQPADEAVVLVAYGDKTYEKEWSALLRTVETRIEAELGITEFAQAWCGHLVHYDPARTTEAVEAVLAKKSRALVVPILVAHDEMFQIKIIGGGVKQVKAPAERVVYRPDAILPDPEVEAWTVETTAAQIEGLPAKKGG